MMKHGSIHFKINKARLTHIFMLFLTLHIKRNQWHRIGKDKFVIIYKYANIYIYVIGYKMIIYSNNKNL